MFLLLLPVIRLWLSAFILRVLMIVKLGFRRLSTKNKSSQKDSCCSWRMLTEQRPSVTLSALNEASGQRTPKLAVHEWFIVVSLFGNPSVAAASKKDW